LPEPDNNNPCLRDRLIKLLIKHSWLSERDLKPLDVLRASLAFLADSRSPVLLINIEDLWMECKPQNIPASGREYPNWQKKEYYGIEELREIPHLNEILYMVNNIREGNYHR
jgi:4-alpha-glucanotransferase